MGPKRPVRARKHANVAREPVVELHEANGQKPVEPCVSRPFHELSVASVGGKAQQLRALLALGGREHAAVDGVGGAGQATLVQDAVLHTALLHVGDELAAGPDRIVLDCGVVHRSLLFDLGEQVAEFRVVDLHAVVEVDGDHLLCVVRDFLLVIGGLFELVLELFHALLQGHPLAA